MEYFVCLWGLGTEKAFPDGEYPVYRWFKTEEEREVFIADVESRSQGQPVARSKYQGEMSHKRTVAVCEFEYDGKVYSYEYDFGYEYPADSAEYMFTDGNYGCDCNRSDFIREANPDFPNCDCGHLITLKSFKIEYRE